jgi:tetratricopeptide (TPR) repeat protein
VEKARRDFPDDDMEWKNTTGMILVQLKKYSEALPVVQAVLNSIPDDEVALKNLFHIFKELKDTERLLQTGARFLRNGYSDKEVFVELGKAYAGRGNYPKAKEAFHQGLRADPYNHEIAGELLRIGF